VLAAARNEHIHLTGGPDRPPAPAVGRIGLPPNDIRS
jgi:hypothetical protein